MGTAQTRRTATTDAAGESNCRSQQENYWQSVEADGIGLIREGAVIAEASCRSSEVEGFEAQQGLILRTVSVTGTPVLRTRP